MLKLILILAFFLGFAQAQAQTVAGTIGEFARLRVLDGEKASGRAVNDSAAVIKNDTKQYSFFLGKYAEYNALASKAETQVKDAAQFDVSIATLKAAREELNDIVTGKLKAGADADGLDASGGASSAPGLPSPYSMFSGAASNKEATPTATRTNAQESEILNNFRPSATPTN